MGKRQTVAEPALFHLHAGVLEGAMVFGCRKDQRSPAGSSTGEYEPVERHRDFRPQAALAIVDAEDQHSPWHKRRAAPFQQSQLFFGWQILQDVQNKNQPGGRKIETANVGHA
jgi:hypothetical protein